MKTPKIRFKGYTEDWEQRKLSDYLEVSKEKNKEETFGKEDVLSVSGEFGIVNQIEFQGRSFAGASVANYGVVEVGDVVYTKSPLKSNPYGIIKTNQGKSGIVSTLYAVYKARNSVNPEFVQIYFELDSRMNSYMHPLVNKGAKNDMKVSDENALKGPVIFPEIEEQKLISQYFARLDRLITLHQRKCKQIKKLKKFMLQNMFPKNGEYIPTIRFEGFTNDWEQRKLGDEATEMFAGGDIDKEKVVDNGKYPIYANALTNDGIVGYYDDYYRVKAPAVTVTGRGDVGHAQARTTDFTPVVRLLAIRSKHDIYFLENAINNHGVIVESTGVPQLTVPQLGNYTISFPKTIDEETKIGEYFYAIDHLITLHQRKCDELQNLKKYMLQNMFI